MTNNIDINLILKKVEDINKNKVLVINNLLKKVDKYDGLESEHKRLIETLKSIDIIKKIMLVVEIFIASNYTMSSRAMEKYLKLCNSENENVPVLSKSAIDRYLRNEDIIINNYGIDLYNKILESRIIITENARIAKSK